MEKKKNGGNSSSSNNGDRENHRTTPLSAVVSDCVKRWFQEAKGGDFSIQLLLSHMYYNGYGLPKDPQKGRIWMTIASKVRSSVWKVSNKLPGYNASDSHSDESKDDS